MKRLFYLLLLPFSFAACQDIDDEILPILGVYEAHVVGLAGPFSLNISAAGNDDILIEAPFDGEIWSVVHADIDETDELKWDIDIFRQELAPGIEIWGDGFYYQGVVQLDYSMRFFGDRYDYRIVGSD
ncbi:MAG: hypothetical protein IPN29_14055 [Saprospiraceae bacterium]|nr:hypothetical protein [Saprospiraceae bacterium]